MLARWGRVSKLIHCLRQYFARQSEINRAHGLTLGNAKRAVDNGLELLAVAQLIVPFNRLAKHSRLIEHFLGPMNVEAAMSGQAILVGGCSPRRKQHWHLASRRVEQAVHAVGSADID